MINRCSLVVVLSQFLITGHVTAVIVTTESWSMHFCLRISSQPSQFVKQKSGTWNWLIRLYSMTQSRITYVYTWVRCQTSGKGRRRLDGRPYTRAPRILAGYSRHHSCILPRCQVMKSLTVQPNRDWFSPAHHSKQLKQS